MAEPIRIPPPGSRYLTYPHNEGFRADGRRLLVVEARGATQAVVELDLATGAEREVLEVPDPFGDYLWFDLATRRPGGDLLVLADRRGLMGLELDRPGAAPFRIYELEAPWQADHLPSVSPDGDKAILAVSHGDRYGFRLVEVATGRVLASREWPWYANHFHFCPFDPSWVGFSHEGATDTIPDRVWVWHGEHAPEGLCCLDQNPDRQPLPLYIGHERWAFHAVAAMAVAYGVSPRGPRGVWMANPENGSQRLVSEGHRDWHVNIDRAGRYAVVDTTGPHDLPGEGWRDARDVSDVVRVEVETGERHFLARSSCGAGQHVHPHPAIGPDGGWVAYNECVERDGRGDRSRVRWVRLVD